MLTVHQAPSLVAHSSWQRGCACSYRHRHRWRPCSMVWCKAAQGGNPDGGDMPDIDDLARQLSLAGARMRADLEQQDVRTNEQLLGADSSSEQAVGPFGYQSPEAEARVFAEMGEGRVIAQDFILLQQLGRLSVQQQEATAPLVAALGMSAGEGEAASQQPEQQTAVVMHAASYSSGLPFQTEVPMLLKEYLPGARTVACNELLVLNRLCGGIPEETYQAAVADPRDELLVVPLLGYFEAPQSEAGYGVTGSGEDSLWLAFKWEGMRPLSLYLQRLEPPRPPTGAGALMQSMLFGGARGGALAAAIAARCAMLRAICIGVLRGLAFCHASGVAHCSLGPGSVMLSSCDDTDAARLLVRLDNFGFARLYPQPDTANSAVAGAGLSSGASAQEEGLGALAPMPVLNGDDSDAALQQRQDLQAAGLLLAELLLSGARQDQPDGGSSGGATSSSGGGGSSSGGGGGCEALSGPALHRLLFDVFAGDMQQFREYCVAEDASSGFVEMMDEVGGAGWEMLGALVEGRTPAAALLQQSGFLQASVS